MLVRIHGSPDYSMGKREEIRKKYYKKSQE
jgi:hypothetical protein